MPANPGNKKALERQKKKRAAAQKARKAANAVATARAKQQAAEAEQAAAQMAAEDEGLPQPFVDDRGRAVDYDELDAKNEEINALIKKKKLDDAEREAHALSKRFPNHSDGLMRLAKIHELRGDLAKARDALIAAGKRENEGDDEVAEEIERELARVQARLGS